MSGTDGWENFYVIVGSSAAALTGLMFVVISLTADVRASGEEAVNAFSSPTVLHFCFVLLIAAIVMTPRHTPGSLAICLGVGGLAGLAYTVMAVLRMRRQTAYTPVLEDWLWHAVFPLIAYAGVAVGTLTLWRRPGALLYLIAACTLLLLYTGIHNSWDAAMYLVMRKHKPSLE
ncbi:MAG: hypothetical protein ACRENK_15320 [Gemmatimonadaceae bacterium]